MINKFIKEEDMAKIVVDYFERLQYQVYKEVTGYGGRLDIYCVKENDTIAIETKLNIGLTLMEQAHNWLGRVNRVFLAIPYKKKSNLFFAKEVCRNFGIGIMLVSDPQYYEPITEFVPAAVCTDPSNPPLLFDEQKLSVAGNARGEFVTPFGLTRRDLVEYVKTNPGCSLSDAVRDIKHHYQHEISAKSSLRKLIIDGVIDELRLEKLNNDTKLWVRN